MRKVPMVIIVDAVVNVFYVAVAIFAISAALLGPWLERNGPLKGLLLGSGLFFFGNLLTALGVYVKQLAIVYIGYGKMIYPTMFFLDL